MKINNHAIITLYQFASFDLKTFLESHWHKYSKVAAVALAMLSATLAAYYLVRFLINIENNQDCQATSDMRDDVILSVENIQKEERENYLIPAKLTKAEDQETLIDLFPKKDLTTNKDALYRAEPSLPIGLPAVPQHKDSAKAITMPAAKSATSVVELSEFTHQNDKVIQRGPAADEGRDLIAQLQESKDSLKQYTSELAEHIKKIIATMSKKGNIAVSLTNLASYLTLSDHCGEILTYCQVTGKQDYELSIIQSQAGGYRKLCEMIKSEQFPIEKKMEALERLEAERHQCVPARGGMLHEICNSMEEPPDMADRLPWIIARYKVEVIRAVIPEPHNLHAFLIKYGDGLGLPDSLIEAAKTDFHHKGGLASLWLPQYRTSCTKENCLAFIVDYINSDIPIREPYRSYILSCLAEKVPDEIVDKKETQAAIRAKHQEVLKKDKAREKANLCKKFIDISNPEAVAEWEKILRKIQLKENPFIDAGLYAHYRYRSNPEDSEDNKLTSEAIRLFVDDSLQSLHVPSTIV